MQDCCQSGGNIHIFVYFLVEKFPPFLCIRFLPPQFLHNRQLAFSSHRLSHSLSASPPFKELLPSSSLQGKIPSRMSRSLTSSLLCNARERYWKQGTKIKRNKEEKEKTNKQKQHMRKIFTNPKNTGRFNNAPPHKHKERSILHDT